MGNNTIFVLLAAGKSERMGVDKGLLKYQHTFWILEQLNRISRTTISKVFIGLGYNYQHYFKAIPWFKDAVTKPIDFQGLTVTVVINKQPQFGSFSTLQSILKQLKETCSILLNPIDIPLLTSSELHKILEKNNSVVIPNFEGKNGHPIKIDFTFWQKLLKVNAVDKEARLNIQIKKLKALEITHLEIFDKSILQNLNTKKEWVSFLKKNV